MTQNTGMINLKNSYKLSIQRLDQWKFYASSTGIARIIVLPNNVKKKRLVTLNHLVVVHMQADSYLMARLL